MEDLQATTLTGRETTLRAAAVEAFKKSLLHKKEDSYARK